MTIVELIKLIKPIPELFIRKYNIFCFEAFVNGWYYRDNKEDVKSGILYSEFYEWLRKRYNIDNTMGWANILYYKFETEEKALDEFFILFNTFYKEKYNSSLW